MGYPKTPAFRPIFNTLPQTCKRITKTLPHEIEHRKSTLWIGSRAFENIASRSHARRIHRCRIYGQGEAQAQHGIRKAGNDGGRGHLNEAQVLHRRPSH